MVIYLQCPDYCQSLSQSKHFVQGLEELSGLIQLLMLEKVMSFIRFVLVKTINNSMFKSFDLEVLY